VGVGGGEWRRENKMVAEGLELGHAQGAHTTMRRNWKKKKENAGHPQLGHNARQLVLQPTPLTPPLETLRKPGKGDLANAPLFSYLLWFIRIMLVLSEHQKRQKLDSPAPLRADLPAHLHAHSHARAHFY
jgi:hypothetical protein